MKNRIIVFIVTLVAVTLSGVERLSAQNDLYNITVDPIYLNIDANQDREVRKTFTLTIDFYNGGLSLVEEIDLFVKLNEVIANGIGAVIDPSKIKIELKEIIEGPRKNQLNKYPTILLSHQSQKIVEGRWRIGRPALSAGGGRWVFLLDMIIGKDDLKGLENGIYPLNLEFKFDLEVYWFLNYNRRYSSTVNSFGQINVVNYAPSFGFEVNANASLNFTKPEDYTKQVESTGNSWLKVVSKHTPYIVQVKTNNADFVGDKGTVPVNSVSMKVDGSASNASSSTVPSIKLSTNEQIVFKGKATASTPHILDVRYFITKSEAEKLATKRPGQYTTTLTYTLTPP